MGFSRQEYWSGWPCHPPGNLPYTGIKPASPALQADFLPLTHWGCPVPIYFMLMSQLGLSCNLSPLLILKYYTLCTFTNPYAIISLPILLVLFISVQLLARLPCPSPTPRVCSNSCPSSQWCHPIISSSVIPFSSCLQSLPASRSFPMSQFFTSGGQSVGASASVLPMNIQDWVLLG